MKYGENGYYYFKVNKIIIIVLYINEISVKCLFIYYVNFCSFWK